MKKKILEILGNNRLTIDFGFRKIDISLPTQAKREMSRKSICENFQFP